MVCGKRGFKVEKKPGDEKNLEKKNDSEAKSNVMHSKETGCVRVKQKWSDGVTGYLDSKYFLRVLLFFSFYSFPDADGVTARK